MKLLADSGSTKTAWAFLERQRNTEEQISVGINPTQQNETAIRTVIADVVAGKAIKEVYFYGSGVIEENKYKIQKVFQDLLPNLEYIEIHNDVYGAARGLCQREAGIVGIAGTGSNSCVYDGQQVIANIGGLGFILGDEGSGAVLGTKLLRAFLYKKIPNDLYQILEDKYQLSTDYIFQKVYYTPLPNRFLATFAPFVYQYRQHEFMRELLKEHFSAFFKAKVWCYDNYQAYPCHLVGSIAHYFQEEIRATAKEMDITVCNIQRTPMQGLIEYHQC